MPQTKEEKKEYKRLYDLKNKVKKNEQSRLQYQENKEKKRLHYEENKEEIKEKRRLYRLKNKEKINEKQRLYNQENKEEVDEKHKLWIKTPKGMKSYTKANWRQIKVFDNFNDNYETLYKIYLSTKFCENCNIGLNIEGDYRTKKTLDHCHASGYFRNILCHCCNIKRG